MTHRYLVCGLHVWSDVEVPGWQPDGAHGAPDVHVTTGGDWRACPSEDDTLLHTSPNAGRSGRPSLRVWRTAACGSYCFAYDDSTRITVDGKARRIRCVWPEGATTADKAIYLRGPILGFALRMRGILCLHASVVAEGDRALILVGSVGAGKSTTAAALVERGLRFVGDDLAPLIRNGGAFHVLPGYPWVNLWPDSARALNRGADLPRLIPSGGLHAWFDKRYFDVGAGRYQGTPVPPGAVYVLDERSDADTPSVEHLGTRAGLMALVSETYMNVGLDRDGRIHEFHTLVDLARTTPVRLVRPHSSPDRLPDLCDVLLEDWRQTVRAAA